MTNDRQVESTHTHVARVTAPSKKHSRSTSATAAAYSTGSALSAHGSMDMVVSSSPTTYLDSTPITSPSDDPSIVAVHGSVPSSPIFKGQRGLDKSSNINHKPRDARGRQLAKQDWEQSQNGITGGEGNKFDVVDETIEAVRLDQVKRTSNNGRVIAVDFDTICTVDLIDSQDRTQGQEKGGASANPTCASDFARALIHLRALGHPIHLITALPNKDQDVVIAWLTAQDLKVGTNDNDIIAAVWCGISTTIAQSVPMGVETPVDDGDKQTVTKLNVIRAINASLFITGPGDDLKAILQASPPIPCLLCGPTRSLQSNVGVSTVEDGSSSSMQNNAVDVGLGSDAPHRVQVIQWVRAWDEADGKLLE